MNSSALPTTRFVRARTGRGASVHFGLMALGSDRSTSSLLPFLAVAGRWVALAVLLGAVGGAHVWGVSTVSAKSVFCLIKQLGHCSRKCSSCAASKACKGACTEPTAVRAAPAPNPDEIVPCTEARAGIKCVKTYMCLLLAKRCEVGAEGRIQNDQNKLRLIKSPIREPDSLSMVLTILTVLSFGIS